MIVDLTLPIRPGMTSVPGDPPVTIRPALTLAEDGVAVIAVGLGSHTGSHLDAPAHLLADGRTVDRVALEELVGEALVLRVEATPDEMITLDRIGELPATVPSIVLVATGWDRFAEDPQRALHHPALAEDAVRTLLDRGMHVLGVDTLSPDPTLQ
ncbi:cyclase family protein [Tersicoccus sp. Bi-70]|uniref:cyclase family protein n=1 Tax=Tersicoccus sp. Bi-70 TaxID=1897634 RepID=UPI001E3149FA|nr:cyclase family protein [Tersicoccus sp. Bi-70]